MSEQTKIAWCDSTINFWEGCTKVSAGCQHCYAEARDKRFTGGKLWGKGAPRRKSKSAVKDALAFNRKPWVCDECGDAISGKDFPPSNPALAKPSHYCGINGCKGQSWHRRRIFSLSLGDWLDDEVPIEWLAEMLDTIRQCDQVTWILCTKRPENFFPLMQTVWRRLCTANADTDEGCRMLRTAAFSQRWESGVEVPENIILLTSVENQEAADKRIPELLKIPAACRGLSLEPLLGPVEVCSCMNAAASEQISFAHNECRRKELGWLIIGGESGTNARLCDTEWIRNLVAQGKASGMATFVKQLGASSGQTHSAPNSRGIPIVIRDKKGGDPAEWPEDLRVQEWPHGL